MENNSGNKFFGLGAVWQLVFSSSRSKIINFLFLVLIVAAIPLMVFVAQRQQDLRQRAQTGASVSCDSPANGQVLAPGNVTFTVTIHGYNQIRSKGRLIGTLNVETAGPYDYSIPVDDFNNLPADVSGSQDVLITVPGSKTWGMTGVRFIPETTGSPIDFGNCSGIFIISSTLLTDVPTPAPCQLPRQIPSTCNAFASNPGPLTGCVLCTDETAQRDVGTITNCTSGAKDCTPAGGAPNSGQAISVVTKYKSCDVKNYDCPDGQGGWREVNVQTNPAQDSCVTTEQGCIGTPYNTCPVVRGDTANCSAAPVPTYPVDPTDVPSPTRIPTGIGGIDPTVPASACTVCGADINQDGWVDAADLSIFISCRGQQPTGNCENADINGDGRIDDVGDLACIQNKYAQQCSTNSIPSPTVPASPARPKGDYNGNGSVTDPADYDTWLAVYRGAAQDCTKTNTVCADGNNDSGIDILDFNVWYIAKSGSRTFTINSLTTDSAFDKEKSVNIPAFSDDTAMQTPEVKKRPWWLFWWPLWPWPFWD